MREIAQAAWECADPGMQYDTTINEWHTCPASGRINGSNPCSEYMHLDNTACNLASLNLMKFLDDDGTFDVAELQATPSRSCSRPRRSWWANPTTRPRRSATNARAYRQLGLGYANLGALLMARGLPYDSDGGRAWAGAITALMTGQAYRTSARIAEVRGRSRATPRTPTRCSASSASTGRRPRRSTPSSCPRGCCRPRSRRGTRRSRSGSGPRVPQRAGVGAGAHRHDRADDGLRHDRDRAGPRARQDEEARRRRHHAVREPDGAAGAGAARLRRRRRSRTSSPTSPSTTRWWTRRT